MAARGLITIADSGFWPIAFITARGILALKQMVIDKQALGPDWHRHLLAEAATLPV